MTLKEIAEKDLKLAIENINYWRTQPKNRQNQETYWIKKASVAKVLLNKIENEYKQNHYTGSRS